MWGTTASEFTLPTTTATAKASIGDFNGDGKTDILWHDTQTGSNTLWLMNGATTPTVSSLPTLSSAWTASIADFNGTTKTDILWHNTQTGQNQVWLMNGATASQFTLPTTTATAKATVFGYKLLMG